MDSRRAMLNETWVGDGFQTSGDEIRCLWLGNWKASALLPRQSRSPGLFRRDMYGNTIDPWVLTEEAGPDNICESLDAIEINAK